VTLIKKKKQTKENFTSPKWLFYFELLWSKLFWSNINVTFFFSTNRINQGLNFSPLFPPLTRSHLFTDITSTSFYFNNLKIYKFKKFTNFILNFTKNLILFKRFIFSRTFEKRSRLALSFEALDSAIKF